MTAIERAIIKDVVKILNEIPFLLFDRIARILPFDKESGSTIKEIEGDKKEGMCIYFFAKGKWGIK